MSSNVAITPGSGAVIRTDGIAGNVQVPASKMVLGDSGVDAGFVSSDNPLPVYNQPVTSVCNYGTATLVPSGSETTVSAFTVPAAHTLLLSGFVASGNMNGQFNLYVDASLILTGRNTVAEQTIRVPFFTPYAVAAGSTVRVKILHSNSGLLGDFEASIMGNQQ